MYIWETGVTAGLWHRLRDLHSLASFGVNFLYILTRLRDTSVVRKHTLWSPQTAHQNTNPVTHRLLLDSLHTSGYKSLL